MHYEIRGTDLAPFSPHTRSYVDYPILLGDLIYVNDTKIRQGQITSSNVIDCNKFNFGKRVGILLSKLERLPFACYRVY